MAFTLHLSTAQKRCLCANMTSSTTPTGRAPRRSGNPLPDSCQLVGADLPRNAGFRPVLDHDRMLCIELYEHPSPHGDASTRDYHSADHITAQEETNSPPVNSPPEHVATNNLDLVDPLRSPLNDNPSAEEVTELVVASRAAADGDRRLNRAAVTRARLVKVLLGGAVSVIVVPGVVLGVLVNTMAGIAISSAITGLANLLAGWWYYLHR